MIYKEGVDGTGIRAGFIGEIGVSARFTSEEEKVLRGAARAQTPHSCPADDSSAGLGTPRPSGP